MFKLKIMTTYNYNELGNYYMPPDQKFKICVDIGANCGSFSLKYQNIFDEIHAYEPQSKCFNICKERLSSYKNIKIYNEAVYYDDKSVVIMISHHNNDSGSCTINSDVIKVKEWTNNIIDSDIKTIDLNKILERLNNEDIDYMKVDCETGEFNFLNNKDLSKIKRLAIEIHHQLGVENWYKLINHILKYFNNIHNYDLNYVNGQNKEFYFESK